MEDNEIHFVYPISWITVSPAFTDFMTKLFKEAKKDITIADFASGEHDRVPSFFIRHLPRLLGLQDESIGKVYVYSIDLHSLRLDSLLGKHEESHLLDRARVVRAKIESMDQDAAMRPAMTEFIQEHPDTATWLDDFLIEENRFPPECFDLGVLNNDIIGYMLEYYQTHSDVIVGLQKVRSSIRTGGLLAVTMPCSLYVLNNVAALEKSGFEFLEGFDVDLSTKEVTFVEKDAEPGTMSRLGHYTLLLFTAK